MFPITIFLTLLVPLRTSCQCRKLHYPYLAMCCHSLAPCHEPQWPLLKGIVQPCPLQSTSTCTHATTMLCRKCDKSCSGYSMPKEHKQVWENTFSFAFAWHKHHQLCLAWSGCQGLLLLSTLDASQCTRPSHAQGCRVHPYTLQQQEDFWDPSGTIYSFVPCPKAFYCRYLTPCCITQFLLWSMKAPWLC